MASATKRTWVEILRPAWSLVEFDGRELVILLSYVLALGVISAAVPLASQVAVNQIAFTGDAHPVFILAAVVLATMLLGAVIKLFQLRVIELLAKRVLARTAFMSVRSLLNRESSGHELEDREIASKFFEVVSFQNKFAVLVSDGISVLVLSILGTVALAFYHPFLLSFSLVVVLVCSLILAAASKRAIEVCSERSTEKYRVAHWISEVAENSRLLRQAPESKSIGQLTDRFVSRYVRSHFAYVRILLAQGAVLFGLQAFASAAYFGVGGWLVVQGKLNLGQLVAAEIIILTVLSSVGKLNYYLDQVYEILVAAEKIDSLVRLSEASSDAVPKDPLPVLEFVARSSLLREPLLARPGEIVAVRGSKKASGSSLLSAIAAMDRSKVDVELISGGFASRAAVLRSILLIDAASVFRLSLSDNLELLAGPRGQDDAGGAFMNLRVLRSKEKESGVQALRDCDLSFQDRARLAAARALFSDRPVVLMDSIFDAMETADQIAFLRDFRERHPEKILLVHSRDEAIDPHFARVAVLEDPAA